MSETTPKGLMKRPSCHILPLIFVLWFIHCYLGGGDGIFFALMSSFPTVLVEKIPFVEACVKALFPTYPPAWWQWTEIFVYGYIQWLLLNYLLLRGIHLVKRRSANRQVA